MPPFLSSLLLNKYTIFLVILLAVGGYSWVKIKTANGKIASLTSNLEISEVNNITLKSNNEYLKINITEQQKTLNQFQKNLDELSKIRDDVGKLEQTTLAKLDKLETKFTKSSGGKNRDIGKIGTSKPKLLEKIINSASNNKLRCMELLTGSPKTNKELKEDYVNKECPEYFK